MFDSNAEGVRQFQPRVGAPATTLGSHQENRDNPEKGSPLEEPFQGSCGTYDSIPGLSLSLQPWAEISERLRRLTWAGISERLRRLTWAEISERLRRLSR